MKQIGEEKYFIIKRTEKQLEEIKKKIEEQTKEYEITDITQVTKTMEPVKQEPIRAGPNRVSTSTESTSTENINPAIQREERKSSETKKENIDSKKKHLNEEYDALQLLIKQDEKLEKLYNNLYETILEGQLNNFFSKEN